MIIVVTNNDINGAAIVSDFEDPVIKVSVTKLRAVKDSQVNLLNIVNKKE
jgi:hypothetical protein